MPGLTTAPTTLDPGWTNALTSTTLKAALNKGAETTSLNYSDCLSLMNTLIASMASGTTEVGSNVAADLELLASKGTALFKSSNVLGTSGDYLAYVFSKMVGHSPANAFYTGGNTQSQALGDLTAATTRDELQLLVNKWLLGKDLPNPELGGDSANPNASSTVGVYASFKDKPLFVEGATRVDVSQGQMGDCYFLAALVSVADTKPGYIEGMFVDNGNGTWGVQFRNAAGQAVWVTVNDQLPTMSGTASRSDLVIGKSSTSDEIWIPLLEKAYTQVNETGLLGRQSAINAFKAIEGGWGDAMLTIAGGVSVTSFMQQGINWTPSFVGSIEVTLSNEALVTAQILDALNSGKTMWLASFQVNPATGVSELVSGHAYSLEDPNKGSLSDTNFLVQNPWGITVDAQGNPIAEAGFKSPFARSVADVVHAIATASSPWATYVVQILDYSAGSSNLYPVFYSADGTPSEKPPTASAKSSIAANAAAIATKLVDSSTSTTDNVKVPLTQSLEKEVRDISGTAALYLSANQNWQILPNGAKFSSIVDVTLNGKVVTDDTLDALALKVERLGTTSADAATQALTKLSPVAANNGYVVLMRDYTNWNSFKVAYVDERGALNSGSMTALSASQLYALETAYGEDLNGSDSIGNESTLLDDGDYLVSELADATLQIASGTLKLAKPLTVTFGSKPLSMGELTDGGYSYDGLETVQDASGRTTGFVLYLYDANTGNELTLNLDSNGSVVSTGVELMGTNSNDTVQAGPGNNKVDGGAGIDTLVYAGLRSSYTLAPAVATTGVACTVNKSGAKDAGTDQLRSVERLTFSDGKVALDLAPTDHGGQALLLIGAVLGKDLMLSKRPLDGTVIDLLDQGYTVPQLAGALMRLPIWGGVLTPTNSSTDIATYLFTRVNGRAPSATELGAAVKSLDTDTQGTYLAQLALSAANITQVDLVGIGKTGFDYPAGG